MGDVAGGQAEEQAAAPSWPLVHQLDAASLLAEDGQLVHAGTWGTMVSNAPWLAIRRKHWRNRGMLAEVANTFAATADTEE